MFNKSAQIGETMTWIVATVIIIVVLGVSILVASAYFKGDKKPDLQSVSGVDTLASKSLFAFVLTQDESGEKIYDQLKTEKNLNEFNGNLAKKVFNPLKQYYSYSVWVGFLDKGNIYFGETPAKQIGTASSNHQDPFANHELISEDIGFSEINNSIKFFSLLMFKQ